MQFIARVTAHNIFISKFFLSVRSLPNRNFCSFWPKTLCFFVKPFVSSKLKYLFGGKSPVFIFADHVHELTNVVVSFCPSCSAVRTQACGSSAAAPAFAAFSLVWFDFCFRWPLTLALRTRAPQHVNDFKIVTKYFIGFLLFPFDGQAPRLWMSIFIFFQFYKFVLLFLNTIKFFNFIIIIF